VGEAGSERFEPTNGRFSAYVGLGLIGLLAVGSALDGWHDSDPALFAGLALVALLVGAVLLRPVVRVEGRDLVLQNMFSTTRVDLAAVDDVEVRHVLTVLAAGQRIYSTALHRQRAKRVPRGRRPGSTPQPAAPVHPVYADLVESRLKTLASDARRVRTSPAGDAVRRTWSWPLVGATAVLAVVTLVLLLAP
jgi:hypothetical protein